MKSCFTHCSCVVIILFNTGLWRFRFAPILFGKRDFHLSMLSVLFLNQMFTLKYMLSLLKKVLAAI